MKLPGVILETMSSTKINIRYLIGVVIILITILGCGTGSNKPPTRNPKDAEKKNWRQLRMDHFERGIQEQGKLVARLRSIPANFGSDKNLIFDAVADCITMNRIGKIGNGGKWICNEDKIKEHSVVYSFGAGPDISFEEAMARRYGCEVHVFDPSPKAVERFVSLAEGKKYGDGSVTFHSWGIGPVSDTPEESMRLIIDGVECQVKTLD